MKKVIAFDLDGTLAPSKSPLPDRMGEVFAQLLEEFDVCVISGGKFGQFQKQLLNGLHATPEMMERLHLMPTCGTQYYAFDIVSGEWQRKYAELIEDADKQRIIDALNKGFDDLGYRAEKVYGETIEDRESQITFSVLGQDIVDVLGEEGVRQKHEWDEDNSKKEALRDYIAPLIPDFEVRVGGVTSIDVTRPGIDKAFGIQKLMDMLGIGMSDVLFIGDRMQEGGNDYPVKAMGVDSIAIRDWQETASVVQAVLYAGR